MSHTRQFVCVFFFVEFFKTIWTDIWTGIRISEYYLGCQKKLIPNIKYYLVLRKSGYRIQMLLFGPTIQMYLNTKLFVTPFLVYSITKHCNIKIQPSSISQSTV